MHLRVIVEYDEITHSYSSVCPEVPGLASCGDTEDEALDNFKEAALLFFEPVEIPLENKHIHELVI